MKNNVIVFLILIILFINNYSFIDCTLIDGKFEIQDITSSPVYDKYTDQSNIDKCTFDFVFYAECVGFGDIPTISLPVTPYSISNSTVLQISKLQYAIYNVQIVSKISPTESNISLELSGCGQSVFSYFPFRYQCHEININELKFTQSPIQYNSIVLYHAFIKVEGNKYPINFNGLYKYGKDLYYTILYCFVDISPTSNCTQSIDFINTSIILTFDSYFKNSVLNTLGKVNTYPNFTTTPNYIQTSLDALPLLTVNFKSDSIPPYFKAVVDIYVSSYSYPMYSESDGSINYLIPLKSSSSALKNLTFSYQQNDIAVVGFKSQYSLVPFSIPNIIFDTRMESLAHPFLNVFVAGIVGTYKAAPMTFSTTSSVYSGVDFPFPFGVTRASNSFTDFQYGATFIFSYLYYNIQLGQKSFNSNQGEFNITRGGVGIPDSDPPIIKNIQVIKIDSGYYLLRIEASDENGLAVLRIEEKSFNIPSFLVSGNTTDGIFEIPFNTATTTISVIRVIDVYGNLAELYGDGYYSLNPIKQFNFIGSKANLPYLDISLVSVSFDRNEMDITNQNSFNTMYLKLDSSLIVDDISILVLFLGSGDSQLTDIKDGYLAKYDQVKQQYYINFTIKKNSMRGPLNYFLSIFPYPGFLNQDIFKQQVILTSNTVDNVGPLVTSISKLSSDPVDLNLNSSMVFGWDITIGDQYNGFSNGYIVVNGLSDGSIYNFTLEAQNDSGAVSFAENSFKLIISNASCISQTFQINTVVLYDNMGIDSYFDRFTTRSPTFSADFTMNPLSRFLGDDSIIQINVTCTPTIEDPTPPVLDSITPNVSSIDVGSNSRALSFEIQVSDPDSGINTSQSPTVYITSLFFERVECKSKLKTCNQGATSCTFKCETEMPLGFGYPNQLYYQVYGIWNRNGMLSGYNHINIQDLYSSDYILNISTTYSRDIPVITNTNRYSTLDKQLLIIGKSIGTAKFVKLSFENKTTSLVVPTCYYSSYCVIQIENIYSQFTIQIQSNNNQLSNIYSIMPNIVSIQENPSESCPGDPVCGGPSKGFCTSKGCVCYDPWVGNQCQYKTIIVPQPSFNGTDPNITIIVPNENNSDQVQFTSLTSIISIRELDLTNNAIGTYRFERWINNQINSTFNEYYANFTNINNRGKTTQVKVTIQWFENQTNVTFAGSTLSMSPSSVKYTIQIKDYPFISALNQLQIVISASFKSNDNQVCSDKEFGDTNGWDDSNYLKIKVGDHSLYARFIKRGIIDSNRTVTLSNSILDNSFKTIEESNELQSYIGITIQNFESEVLIDPDFSILLDSSSLSSNAICKSSGLTTSQLVGIIIGSVAFVAVVVICITYFIIKKKEKATFETKLKTISSNQNL